MDNAIFPYYLRMIYDTLPLLIMPATPYLTLFFIPFFMIFMPRLDMQYSSTCVAMSVLHFSCDRFVCQVNNNVHACTNNSYHTKPEHIYV